VNGRLVLVICENTVCKHIVMSLAEHVSVNVLEGFLYDLHAT